MSRRMGVLALTLVVAAALSALTAATAGARQSAAFKAAWIYVGPHNDHGWSQAHDEGRLYVQKMLGSKVQTTFKENVPEGPQTAQVIDSLVRDGNKIIFATSFGYQDAMVAAAKKYPDVNFEQATGYKTVQEPGRVLRRGRGRDLPLGHGRRRGDQEGRDRLRRPVRDPRGHPPCQCLRARRAGRAPGAKVKLVWTKSWLDPDKEKKAAESLHTSGGADVLGQNVDSPPTGQYAECGGHPVGRLRLRRADVRAQVVAHGRRLPLGPLLLKQVKAAMAGTWK